MTLPAGIGSVRRGLTGFSRVVRGIAFIGTLLVAVVWCLQNRQGVMVSFLPFAYGLELPLFLLVLLSFVLGFGLAGLLAWPRHMRMRQQLRHSRQRAQLVEHDQEQARLHRQLAAEMQRDADEEMLPAPPAA